MKQIWRIHQQDLSLPGPSKLESPPQWYYTHSGREGVPISIGVTQYLFGCHTIVHSGNKFQMIND